MRERVILPERTTGASSSSSDFSAWVSESVTSNSHCGGSAPSKYIGFGGVFSLSTLLKQINTNVQWNCSTAIASRIKWNIKKQHDIPRRCRNNGGGRSTTFLSTFAAGSHFHAHHFNRRWLFYCVCLFAFSAMWFLASSVLL